MDGIYFELVLASWSMVLLVSHIYPLSKRVVYPAMLFAPLIGLIILSIRNGPLVWLMLLIGMMLGPLLEWSAGWFFTGIIGRKLWQYNQEQLPGKYTSWYIVPFWGYNIVALWLIFKLIP